MFGGNHLGVLDSCQALLAEFFPKVSRFLSSFHPPLQPGDTDFHKMICFVTTSLQAWHLQLQKPGALSHFHPRFLGNETRGGRRPGMLQSRATEQLN